MKTILLYLFAFAAFTCLQACSNQPKVKSVEKDKLAITDSNSIKLQLITQSIDAPVQMSIAPDHTHRRFITDNSGKIWILKNDSLLSRPFLNISSKPVGKDKPAVVGTISGVAFHPQYETNSKFYVCYNAASTVRGNEAKLVISEFTSDKNNIDIADVKTEHRVFEIEGRNISHNGSEIAFGPDGYLYISIGDDSINDSAYVYRAQDLNFLNGKLLRIDINKTPYAIPPDNPFIGIKNSRPEIWAYGLRKMWRFSFDEKSHQIFGADVGQEKNEEIDIIEKGANYGWPLMEGDSAFEKNNAMKNVNYTAPIYAYTHQEGICIIGGSFYYGKDIPFLKDKYVFADFNGSIFTLTKTKDGQWIKETLKILNKPSEPFLICGCNADENNELYVMGFLNTKTGVKGAVYKIIKG